MTMRIRTAVAVLLLSGAVFAIAFGLFSTLTDKSILTKEHAPVVVHASWAPLEELNGHQLAFGDRVAAELRIAVDSRRVNPDTLRMPPPKWAKLFAPYRVVGTVERTEEHKGSTAVIVYRVVLECRFGGECLSYGKTKQFIFSEKRITYLDSSSGLAESVFAWWPPLSVASRIPPKPDPGIEIFVPTPEVRGFTHRVSPSVAVIVLALLSAILLSSAVFLGAYALPRKRARAMTAELVIIEPVPLLSAIKILEHYLNNPRSEPQELRWALEHVCRCLKNAGYVELALQAERFAWTRDALDDRKALSAFVVEIRAMQGGVR